MSLLSKLRRYMGGRRILFPLSLLLSASSSLAGLVPYILIWFIVRELLIPGSLPEGGGIASFAVWAAVSAVSGVVLYFLALMSSHLAAFRVESNIRRHHPLLSGAPAAGSRRYPARSGDRRGSDFRNQLAARTGLHDSADHRRRDNDVHDEHLQPRIHAQVHEFP